jgi:hypothetical protein
MFRSGGVVVGSYVPFWKGVRFSQFMCLSGRVL